MQEYFDQVEESSAVMRKLRGLQGDNPVRYALVRGSFAKREIGNVRLFEETKESLNSISVDNFASALTTVSGSNKDFDLFTILANSFSENERGIFVKRLRRQLPHFPAKMNKYFKGIDVHESTSKFEWEVLQKNINELSDVWEQEIFDQSDSKPVIPYVVWKSDRVDEKVYEFIEGRISTGSLRTMEQYHSDWKGNYVEPLKNSLPEVYSEVVRTIAEEWPATRSHGDLYDLSVLEE